MLLFVHGINTLTNAYKHTHTHTCEHTHTYPHTCTRIHPSIHPSTSSHTHTCMMDGCVYPSARLTASSSPARAGRTARRTCERRGWRAPPPISRGPTARRSAPKCRNTTSSPCTVATSNASDTPTRNRRTHEIRNATLTLSLCLCLSLSLSVSRSVSLSVSLSLSHTLARSLCLSRALGLCLLFVCGGGPTSSGILAASCESVSSQRAMR